MHEKIKNYLNNWLSRMIESPELAGDMAPLVVYMDDAVEQAEDILGREFDFDPAEMTAARVEILRTIDEFFITPTP